MWGGNNDGAFSYEGGLTGFPEPKTYCTKVTETDASSRPYGNEKIRVKLDGYHIERHEDMKLSADTFVWVPYCHIANVNPLNLGSFCVSNTCPICQEDICRRMTVFEECCPLFYHEILLSKYECFVCLAWKLNVPFEEITQAVQEMNSCDWMDARKLRLYELWKCDLDYLSDSRKTKKADIEKWRIDESRFGYLKELWYSFIVQKWEEGLSVYNPGQYLHPRIKGFVSRN